MLKVFRNKNVAKIVLWGILILILPAFVLWGTGSGARGKDKGPSYVGLVNKKKVTFEEFSKSLASIRCQIVLNYFDKPQIIDMLLKNRPFMGRMAWDRIIMSREAKKMRIKVADGEVVKAIRSHPIFIRNGKFDSRIYGYVLRNNMGMDPRSFEETMRENIAIRKMSDDLTKNVTVSDNEVLERYREDNEKFRISYALISADDFLEKAEISETEVKSYYENHKNEFVLPDKASGEGAGMRLAGFEDVKDSIRSFLAENQAKILAFEYAEDTYKKIEAAVNNGASFESACAGAGIKKQETAPFSKSDYLEGIGEADNIVLAAVKLKKDEISRPIEVRKGSIIFKLAGMPSFDEENFKKEKEAYSKKALERKKDEALETWLRGLEKVNTLNIDLDNYEKYYG